MQGHQQGLSLGSFTLMLSPLFPFSEEFHPRSSSSEGVRRASTSEAVCGASSSDGVRRARASDGVRGASTS